MYNFEKFTIFIFHEDNLLYDFQFFHQSVNKAIITVIWVCILSLDFDAKSNSGGGGNKLEVTCIAGLRQKLAENN